MPSISWPVTGAIGGPASANRASLGALARPLLSACSRPVRHGPAFRGGAARRARADFEIVLALARFPGLGGRALRRSFLTRGFRFELLRAPAEHVVTGRGLGRARQRGPHRAKLPPARWDRAAEYFEPGGAELIGERAAQQGVPRAGGGSAEGGAETALGLQRRARAGAGHRLACPGDHRLA